MDNDEIAATTLANQCLLAALVDFLDEVIPGSRDSLVRNFEAVQRFSADDDHTWEQRIETRAVEVILETLNVQTRPPQLQVVPKV